MGEQTIAETFEKNKQWDEAIKKYKEIYRKDKSLYILSKLLWCYSRNGDYSSAKKCGEKLIEEEPNNPKWLYMLGYQYYMEKDWMNAIEYFEKALIVNPNYFVVLYRISYANLQLAGEYMKLTKSEYWKAIGYLKRAHEIWESYSNEEKKEEQSTYYHICFIHGKAFMLIQNRNEDAIRYFYTALEINDDYNCRYNLCKCLYYNKEYERAKKELPKVNKFYVSELEAQIEYKLSNYDKAVAIIDDLLKYRKKDYLYCLLVDIYIKQRMFNKAFEMVTNALHINNNNHKNHYKLAEVYCAFGLYKHALDEIEKAQTLKQKKYCSDYQECNKLKKFIFEKISDKYVEDEKLFESLVNNNAKYEGNITGYNFKKKFGFVNIDNRRVFVHISNVISGHIKNGTHITFDIEKTEKGYQAINIVAE